MVTRAPYWANWIATAAPIPELDPVTRATLPSKLYFRLLEDILMWKNLVMPVSDARKTIKAANQETVFNACQVFIVLCLA